MNKQELIDELKKEIEATRSFLNFEEHVNIYEKGKRIGLEIGWMFAEKLDEPEKVVIPQFVADWIEKRKDDFESSYDAVSYIKSCGWDDEAHVEYKVYEWLPKNLLAFCKAWELGYTIEEPKLLTVIVKDHDKTIMSKQMPEDEVEKMMEGL